jgi:hypothetical protein
MLTSARLGHISPADVEESLSGVTEALEGLSPAVSAHVMTGLDPLFAKLKRTAELNWKG